jgi:Holliday junction resolvasome RuvABC endonuclease subunit
MVKKNKNVVVQGWDIALNHSGFVELTNGELTNFWYITNVKSSADKSKKHGYRLVVPKTKEQQVKSIYRLDQIIKYIRKTVLSKKRRKPDYVGIEDYALNKQHGSHYMGEVGGLVRHLLWKKRIPFRLHDPLSIKMFTTHDGSAQKDLIEEKTSERWGVDFGKYNQPAPKPSKRNANPTQKRTTSEDLCDAYSVAKLVWTEVQLRSGELLLKELHPKEIQVFNRVTKSYPVSLLDRDWIMKVA